jgi:hypothetical protein
MIPGIDGVDVEADPDGGLDEGHLLGAHGCLAPEIG